MLAVVDSGLKRERLRLTRLLETLASVLVGDGLYSGPHLPPVLTAQGRRGPANSVGRTAALVGVSVILALDVNCYRYARKHLTVFFLFRSIDLHPFSPRVRFVRSGRLNMHWSLIPLVNCTRVTHTRTTDFNNNSSQQSIGCSRVQGARLWPTGSKKKRQATYRGIFCYF